MQTYLLREPKKKTRLHKVLRSFLRWSVAREKRGKVLKLYATLFVKKTPRKTYEHLRRQSATRMVQAQRFCCWVCNAPAQVGHHVIQLQHGGSNELVNLVPLCHNCHADIHPWLPTDAEPKARLIWG